MNDLNIGDIVTSIYKTGKYIGEVTDIRPQHYLVRTLAVLKHPMQGDLHNPKEVGFGFFHERKALAFREQANVPKQMVKPYLETVPSYEDSLKASIQRLRDELTNDTSEWASLSLKNIASIESEYLKK
ncbi:kinase-associated lipoprotein B [Pseudoneobacillus rhizosphaerae]|uniref:Kinase-associated lipoprotein B n=1 Tax=Pseudoneobacillus rhizosphaerae TaxID=2880968 RepID=A0A9C7GBZ5_9BACI|nr:kinase-associated lipoprotein B [Pseudoneobacillus rhizosphaerae]CAG9609704.1 Kinase-associated lipoprotein B [Pseudoneobacillus rhizosphaerae]